MTDSPRAAIIGNTFDYQRGGVQLMLTTCANATLRNNIWLNDGSTAGVMLSGCTAPVSGYNCYWPMNAAVPVETSSFYLNPQIAINGDYSLLSDTSPVRNNGLSVAGYKADAKGHRRNLSTPCIGALEYLAEEVTIDAQGRVARRTLGDRTLDYKYTAVGQLSSFVATDTSGSRLQASYQYDPFGNRVRTTVGNAVTRFVYQDGDVVAEYDDYNNDGVVDHKRVYWILPELDQRIGFVDYDANNNPTVYFYLCDQVGSVMQVVRADNTVVNQYDYDAFGNTRPEKTFETVPNRYRFQGREWDAYAGHYYYRMRTYVPEWGSFTGPDMNLANGIEGESNGLGNYLAMGNDPLRMKDPTGLLAKQEWTTASVDMLNKGGFWNNVGAFGIHFGITTLDVFSLGTFGKNDRLLDRNLAGEISDKQFRRGMAVNTGVAATSLAVGGGAGVLVKGALGVGAATFGGGVAIGAVSGLASSSADVLGTRLGYSANAIAYEGSPASDAKQIAFSTVLGGGIGGTVNGVQSALGTYGVSKNTVLSGHGDFDPANGNIVVPDGTTLRQFSKTGTPITDDLGNAIETGQDMSGLFKRIYPPGTKAPNLTLLAPDTRITIRGNPVTVTQDTLLKDLLKPNMGTVDWAACSGGCNPVFDYNRGTFISILSSVIGTGASDGLTH